MIENIEELKSLLSSPQNITIIAHRNPDGDALGSALGLSAYLKQQGHLLKVVMPSEHPKVFDYLVGIDDMIIFDLKHNEAREAFSKASLIFCLDFNGLDRIDKLGPVIAECEAKKVLIDHHLDPEPFADFVLSDTSASSTAELVYEFIDSLGGAQDINIPIGEALFTGLITDTGSFKYNTRSQTYRVAAALKDRGVDDYYLSDKIFNSMKEKHLRILGHSLANRMKIIPEYGAAYIYLNRKDYIDFDIQRGDTEGIVNYMLKMDNVVMAGLISEQPTIVKLSLRSKGDISVQEICRQHFNGGGHKNASGGGVYKPLSYVLRKLEEVIPQHLTKIEILS